MPFGGSGAPWDTRAHKAKRNHDARAERAEAKSLRAEVAFRLAAPKQRGYRPFLLRNAKKIYGHVLTRDERAVVRREIVGWSSSRTLDPALLEDLGAAHMDDSHTPKRGCEDCFADLIDAVLRRRRNGSD